MWFSWLPFLSFAIIETAENICENEKSMLNDYPRLKIAIDDEILFNVKFLGHYMTIVKDCQEKYTKIIKLHCQICHLLGMETKKQFEILHGI
ncbi:hypothetical protein A3Q56_00634 [Intoshia linei]|uniref:Uncharacterized protein n=1 Tax=Intoshia linei TaxID=1819745 RepID=A0A177BB94_9BILA|nr:hypothetical protein A3Q56_00634 [Intoshia linei]